MKGCDAIHRASPLDRCRVDSGLLFAYRLATTPLNLGGAFDLVTGDGQSESTANGSKGSEVGDSSKSSQRDDSIAPSLRGTEIDGDFVVDAFSGRFIFDINARRLFRLLPYRRKAKFSLERIRALILGKAKDRVPQTNSIP
ncbi:MAG: hypothetical protein R3A47_12015 [Polyangiales bacterium]